MAVQPPGGPLPLTVLFNERFKRSHQFTSVVSFAGLYRAEDRVTEQPQRLVVLQRQQQLEGAEVLVGRHAGGAALHRGAAGLPLTRPGDPEGDRFDGAPGFVERASRVDSGNRPSDADIQPGADGER